MSRVLSKLFLFIKIPLALSQVREYHQIMMRCYGVSYYLSTSNLSGGVMVAMHVLNRTIRLRHLYMALPLVMMLAVPAYSQTFCNRIGGVVVCDGDNGSSRTVAPLGRTGGVITDERGNVTPYSNGVIIDNTSRKPDWERRSDERRRQDIYGEDRRNDSRNRSRYDDER